MDRDPLTSPTTPPVRRRTLAFVRPPLPRLSDLLAAFGAKRLPSSARRMALEHDVRELRPARPSVSYAESEGSTATPTTSPTSSFGDPTSNSQTFIEFDDSSADELEQAADDDNDVIQGRCLTYMYTLSLTARLINLQLLHAERPRASSHHAPRGAK